MKRFALGMAVMLMASVTVRAADNPTVEVSGLGDSVDIKAKDGWLHLNSTNGTELKARAIAFTSKDSPRITVEALPGSQLRMRPTKDGTGKVETFVCSHLRLTRGVVNILSPGPLEISQ